MSDINLEIVGNFFSLHGFFVKSEEFLYIKKLKTGRIETDDFIYRGRGLESVQNAVVSIKPWHSEIFFPSRIKNSYEELFRFLEEKEIKKTQKILGYPGFKKFLVISRLPHNRKTREKSVEILAESGIDMVFQFPDIIDFLIRNVKKSKSTSGDAASQLIKILSCYGYCGVRQPELFQK
jgi:hypothetical protein